MKLNRGDIVIANLESVSKGSIQKYTRPYIIISKRRWHWMWMWRN